MLQPLFLDLLKRGEKGDKVERVMKKELCEEEKRVEEITLLPGIEVQNSVFNGQEIKMHKKQGNRHESLSEDEEGGEEEVQREGKAF